MYLIFSVNKSGEFFGYARMTSAIPILSDAGISDKVSSETIEQRKPACPRLIGPNITVTAQTDTAPAGKIFEDPVRGTIFWEALNLADDAKENDRDQLTWGNIFQVEWIKW